MDPRKYTAPAFGVAHKTPGDRRALWHFVPQPIQRELALDAETVYALSEAHAALGHLQGLGRLIREPELLLGPYMTREALASSRIEGTQASLSDVLQAEAGARPAQTEDVAEVERYLAASRLGLELIKTLPITQRLILQLHATLLEGVRGEEKLPGEYRRSPVWVGSPTDTPEDALYVPPLPDEMRSLLADWEEFVNSPSRLPVLISCGLMHYQFETIHPFLDGNGRIGRLLINLMLMDQRRLTTPLLYLSGYLESHRTEYYERLQSVRERGEIQQWRQFFLAAVRFSADDAVARAGRLVELREQYRADAATTRSNLVGLVDVLFRNPFVTVGGVERQLGITNQGARNIIRQAVERGWLSAIGAIGRGGRNYWVADRIYDVIEAPVSYRREDDSVRVGDADLSKHEA